MSPEDREALVVAAHDSIARGSRSFALASRLFDRPTRERAWLLYAWCRACDDLADGQDMGMERSAVADPAARFAHIRTLTQAAVDGRPTGAIAFDALALVAAEAHIPPAAIDDLVAGFAMDAEGFAPASEEDLLRYCYHVAGCVGVMMAIVMGIDPHDEATLDRACDLGIAFQLANIARDVMEDWAVGRCYLPAQWIAEAGLTRETIGAPGAAEAVATMTARLAALAARYERSARGGTPALSWRSSWAVLAAAGIYGDIARIVRWRGRGALDRRVVTSAREKLAWVIRAATQASIRKLIYRADRPRDGLWTRPRRHSLR